MMPELKRAVCFSRRWRARAEILRRRGLRSPGGVGRFSKAHFGLKQRSPLSMSLSPYRRQSLQTAPVYRAMSKTPDAPCLHSAPLGWAAAVVRYGRYVANAKDRKPRRLQGANGSLASAARPPDEDVHLAHAVFPGAAGRPLRPPPGGGGGALSGALESG